MSDPGEVAAKWNHLGAETRQDGKPRIAAERWSSFLGQFQQQSPSISRVIKNHHETSSWTFERLQVRSFSWIQLGCSEKVCADGRSGISPQIGSSSWHGDLWIGFWMPWQTSRIIVPWRHHGTPERSWIQEPFSGCQGWWFQGTCCFVLLIYFQCATLLDE